MLITYIEHRKSLHEKSTSVLPEIRSVSEILPTVTIMVPCFNEQFTAVKTIDSLLKLDYPSDKLHITVINDGSTDGTALALEKFSNHPQIDIIHKENGGKHTALNLGIQKSTSEFVGCLDADSYVEPDALRRIIRRFDNPSIMAAVPSLHIYKPQNAIQKMQKVEYIVGIFFRSVLAEINALYVTPGPFSIFRKSIFENIGYYRKAHNTEDMEMAMRMQSRGMKIASAHDAVVYTSSPNTIKKLYRQRVRWNSGTLKNIVDYRFMLMNNTYGHIGTFVLPVILILTVGILYVVGLFIYNFLHTIHIWSVYWGALGVRAFEWSTPHFSWFFVGTSPIVFGSIISFTIIGAIILIGSKLSRGNKPRLFDIACYISLYSILAPFWIVKSLSNLARSRQAVWR